MRDAMGWIGFVAALAMLWGAVNLWHVENVAHQALCFLALGFGGVVLVMALAALLVEQRVAELLEELRRPRRDR